MKKRYLKYEIPKNLNNLKTKDINNIARMVANTNTAYYDAIGFAGELNRVLDKLDDDILKKIAMAFIKLKTKHDTELADPETRAKETQDISQHFNRLSELMEEVK